MTLGPGKFYEPVYHKCGGRVQAADFIIMKRQSIIYLVAGTLILTGLALGYWVNQLWLLLAAFVGFNLFQTAFTGFCPLERILIKLGIGSVGKECGVATR